MKYLNYILKCLKHYIDFKGRARRTEFWSFQVFYIIISYIAYLINGTVSTIIPILFVLPLLGVSVRRMHDINKTGFWVLFQIIPLIGVIVFWAMSLMDGTVGDNKYGPDPKA